MNLAEAVRSIVNNNSYYDSARRPSWQGYVKVEPVTDQSEPPVTVGRTLTFKNRAGTTYEYSYNLSTGEWTAPSTAVPIDADLLAGLLADDWVVGKSADYDVAALPSGATGAPTW